MNNLITLLIDITKELVPVNIVEDDEERLAVIGSDSVRMVAFISAIEEELDIELPDEDLDSDFFTSFDNMIDCINKQIERDETIALSSKKA